MAIYWKGHCRRKGWCDFADIACDSGGGVNGYPLAVIKPANVLCNVLFCFAFEPFYTARSGRDQGRNQGGPGLGLSISLNIVTGVLGGTLSASSEPGCGSQFYLTFPINAPQTNRDGTDTGFISPPA